MYAGRYSYLGILLGERHMQGPLAMPAECFLADHKGKLKTRSEAFFGTVLRKPDSFSLMDRVYRSNRFSERRFVGLEFVTIV